MANCPGNMIITSMKQVNPVAYEQNVTTMYKFLTLNFFLIQWRSQPGGRRPKLHVSKKCQQQNEQSYFVHMLHNTTDSSNSEVIIMFPGQFAIDPLVHDEDLSYKIFQLIQLTRAEKKWLDPALFKFHPQRALKVISRLRPCPHIILASSIS